MKPATSRPPEIMSSMAYSSATRIGLTIGTMLPDWRIIAPRVRSATQAPIRLGFGISP